MQPDKEIANSYVEQEAVRRGYMSKIEISLVITILRRIHTHVLRKGRQRLIAVMFDLLLESKYHSRG